MAKDPLFKRFVDATAELQRVGGKYGILQTYPLPRHTFSIHHRSSGKSCTSLRHRFSHTPSRLSQVDITPLNREELMALFINLYNALIIHALVVLGPPTAAQRGSFYSKDSAYCIGGRRYTGRWQLGSWVVGQLCRWGEGWIDAFPA